MNIKLFLTASVGILEMMLEPEKDVIVCSS